jgi:uncharacterized protein YndB with AHSA1/START domain
MLRKVLLGLLVLVVVIVAVVALQPADFRIARRATIAAAPAAVFEQINDFHRWQAWSPWAKLDPACKNTYSGPEAGVGAAMAWDGNNEVGAGGMTILESVPGEKVVIRLEFLRPMKAVNTALFTLTPEGAGTAVEWTMTGKNGFMGKAFSLVVDCDAMVGGDFDKGLANLKGLLEPGK